MISRNLSPNFARIPISDLKSTFRQSSSSPVARSAARCNFYSTTSTSTSNPTSASTSTAQSDSQPISSTSSSSTSSTPPRRRRTPEEMAALREKGLIPPKRIRTTKAAVEDSNQSQSPNAQRRTRRSKAQLDELRALGLVPLRRKTDSKYSTPEQAREEIGKRLAKIRSEEEEIKKWKQERLESGELIKRTEKEKRIEEIEENLSNERRARNKVQLIRDLRKANSKVSLSDLDHMTIFDFQGYLRELEEKYLEDFKLLEMGKLESIDSPKASPPFSIETLNSWLPHPSCWKYTFSKGTKNNFLSSHRYFLMNSQKAKEVVDSLKLGERRDGQKWTVVEAYPGPGVLTRQFLESPHVEKVISMEELPVFTPWLHKLKEDPKLCPPEDPNRLEIIEESGYRWDTYSDVINRGYLNHLSSNGRIKHKDGRSLNVEEVSKNSSLEGAEFESQSPLLFIAQLPNTVHSEQLFAQLVHAISSRSWLFRYGRVRMIFIGGEHLACRSVAEPGEKLFRGKLSASVQALADVKILQRPSQLLPHHHNFFPSHPSVGLRLPTTSPLIPTERVAGPESRYPMSILELNPKKGADQLINAEDLEVFEYITRNLFILKTKSVEEALKRTSPGAFNILKKLQPGDPKVLERGEVPVDPKSRVVDLEVNQLASLARVFDRWPFRPEILFEEGRIRNDQRGKRNVAKF